MDTPVRTVANEGIYTGLAGAPLQGDGRGWEGDFFLDQRCKLN